MVQELEQLFNDPRNKVKKRVILKIYFMVIFKGKYFSSILHMINFTLSYFLIFLFRLTILVIELQSMDELQTQVEPLGYMFLHMNGCFWVLATQLFLIFFHY